jgi:Rad3-related DNA helicase
MSATLGGIEAFAENIGVKYLEREFNNEDEEIIYNIIPSTFDFSKSPIYFLNRYKMSYRDKAASLPYLKQIIYKICSKNFAGQRGMIQTGSYANAKEIYDSAPIEVKNRMLLYNNAKEKTSMITLHQMSEDTILIGPTLVEGIDLPGDQCRFIVILKVPYPVIVDDYVKKKIELFPLWYNSTTSNTIIQGIGRGNRFKDDYCTTYILDACFLALYNSTKSQYPIELQQRIKMYN